MRRKLLLASLAALAAGPALAASVHAQRIPEDAYQSFVMNWTPSDTPLCAAIGSAEQWEAIFHPAPVMGANKPFGPDAAFWKSHLVLLIARVLPGGGPDAFASPAVRRAGASLTVSYTLHPPSRPASYMGKAFLALAVPRLSPATVSFREDGHPVCTLHPAAGAWAAPAPQPAP